MSVSDASDHLPQTKFELIAQSAQPMFFIRPILGAGIAGAVWYYVVFKTSFVIPGDVGLVISILAIILAFFGMWHAIFATMIINTAWSEYEKMKEYALRRRDEQVKKLAEKRIPHIMRAFLLFFSAFIQLFMSLLPYPVDWFGYLGTGSIAFVLIMYWEVAYALDNPIKAPWYQKYLWFIKENPAA